MEVEHDGKSYSDADVMTSFIRDRDPGVFSIIYKRHFDDLGRYLFWLTGNSELAKDITQDIFFKVYDSPELFDPSKSFKVWLFSIAKNRWKNHLRQSSNQLKLLKKIADSHVSSVLINDTAVNDKKIKKIRNAMNQLSEQHRDVVTLKYSNNLSINEISEILNCSEGTVKSRLYYALKNLQKLVKHEY